MPGRRVGCPFIVGSALLLWLTHTAPTVALAQEPSPDARAAATEAQMTDDERLGLIHSLLVVVLKPDFSQKRDKHVPAHVPQIAGSLPGGHGIEMVHGLLAEDARTVFQLYQQRHGLIYNG